MKKPKEEDKNNAPGRHKRYKRPTLRTGQVFQRSLVDCGKTEVHPCADAVLNIS
jgi:hypothetical protein